MDSTTKAATKAAIESGIRSNIFNLAQIKIEQLMAKDSYQRFLKSDQYLELLNNETENIFPILRTTSTKETKFVQNNAIRPTNENSNDHLVVQTWFYFCYKIYFFAP